MIVTPTEFGHTARQIAEVLGVEAVAVQVATVGTLPVDLLERVWTERGDAVAVELSNPPPATEN